MNFRLQFEGHGEYSLGATADVSTEPVCVTSIISRALPMPTKCVVPPPTASTREAATHRSSNDRQIQCKNTEGSESSGTDKLGGRKLGLSMGVRSWEGSAGGDGIEFCLFLCMADAVDDAVGEAGLAGGVGPCDGTAGNV